MECEHPSIRRERHEERRPRPFIASSWCLVRPTKHRTLLRERGAGRRISVLYALAFKHFEDLLIGDAATFAQVAHLG